MGWWVLFGEEGGSQSTSLSDNAILTETLRLVVSRRFAEAVSLSDLVTSVLGRYLSEAVGLTESLTRQTQSRIAETVALSESLRKQVGKIVASGETLALGEGLTTLRVSIANVADTVTPTEALTKAVTVRLADAVLLVDALTKSAVRQVSDTLAPTETFTKQFQTLVSESPGFVETLSAIRVGLVAVGDVLGVSEQLRLDLQRRLNEAVALTEQVQTSLLPGDLVVSVIRMTGIKVRVPYLATLEVAV